MAASKNFSVVRGKRIRVTRLDECGNFPDPGDPCAFVVSKGFVTVTIGAEVEEGDELVQMNANGDLCINDRARPQLKRWNLSVELCDVDPELLSLLTSVTLETDADGNTVGIRTAEGAIEENFALELWSGVGDGECTNGKEYGYLLFPFVRGGTIGDIEVQNDVTTFTVENAYTEPGPGWGVGPYDVVPDEYGAAATLAVAIGSGEHMLMRTTTIAPPAAQVGCQTMPTP